MQGLGFFGNVVYGEVSSFSAADNYSSFFHSQPFLKNVFKWREYLMAGVV